MVCGAVRCPRSSLLHAFSFSEEELGPGSSSGPQPGGVQQRSCLLQFRSRQTISRHGMPNSNLRFPIRLCVFFLYFTSPPHSPSPWLFSLITRFLRCSSHCSGCQRRTILLFPEYTQGRFVWSFCVACVYVCLLTRCRTVAFLWCALCDGVEWTVLCCVVLCCAVLCCAVLCCAVIRCLSLRCAAKTNALRWRQRCAFSLNRLPAVPPSVRLPFAGDGVRHRIIRCTA